MHIQILQGSAQQFWGEVVEFNSDSSAFICECNSEGIIKISQYFPKLS